MRNIPLAPHEIDALPIASRIYATLAEVEREGQITFEAAYEKAEESLKGDMVALEQELQQARKLVDALLRIAIEMAERIEAADEDKDGAMLKLAWSVINEAELF